MIGLRRMVKSADRARVFWCVAVAALAVRVWLVWGVAFAAYMGASYDDAMFFRLAREIHAGNWLGGYEVTTLIKGPFYPMFIAAAWTAHVPLPIAEQAAGWLACLVGVLAIRPLVRNYAVLGIMLIVLCANPYSWGIFPPRFSRDPLAATLALMLAGAVMGWALRAGRWGSVAWACLAGLSAAACWLIREEAIWIVGPAAVAVGAILVVGAVRRQVSVRVAVSAVAVAAALFAMPLTLVCELNSRYYGAFCVVDVKTREFQAAYGALLRVGEKFYRHQVPAGQPARKAIYEVSPTMRSIEPMLEGPLAQRWSGQRKMPEPIDMQGGWFIWAFHEAVISKAGTGGPPLAMLKSIAGEINAACDAGRLPGGSERASLTTPFDKRDMPYLRESLAEFFAELIRWPVPRGGHANGPTTSGDLQVVRQATGTELCGIDHSVRLAGWACSPLGEVDFETLDGRGDALPVTLRMRRSPDVEQYLAARGKAIPGAAQCRFDLTLDGAYRTLRVVVSGQEVAQIPLDGSTLDVASAQLLLHFDSVRPARVRAVSPMRSAVLRASSVAYGVLSPVASAATCVALGVLVWRRRRRDVLFVVACFMGAIVVRTVLLAYIDATTFEVRGTRYIMSSNVLLAYVWVTTAAALVHRRGGDTLAAQISQ